MMKQGIGRRLAALTVALLAAAGGAPAAESAVAAAEAGEFSSRFQEVVSGASARVFPAVVFIHVVTDNLQSGRDEGSVACGSGVVVSPSGEVLTNAHVADKARSIRCLLHDGREFTARRIGIDKDIDLALLQLELPAGTPPLPTAAISEGAAPREGDFVMAMGAPWGLNRSVSIGIISCASRHLGDKDAYSLWYQTDASISPGNSGGPLVDTAGRVVGINTLGTLRGGALAFAIPAPTIRDVLPRLRRYGGVNWAWFGFKLQPLRDFMLNIRFDFADGVIVSGTEPGSPARTAGFQPNDRIIAVNGQPVTVATAEAMPDFRRRLGLFPFKETVRFRVVRDGREREIAVAPVAKGEIEGDEGACPRWGLTAKAINRFDTPNLYFYRQEGVYIYGVEDDGNADNAGLHSRDIIVAVDGRPVAGLAALREIYTQAVANLDKKHKVTLSVLRHGRSHEIVLDFLHDPEKE